MLDNYIIITIINASAAPLDISIEEKFNTTAEYDGNGFTYTTNVTGYINIENKGSDDLYNIWVVVDLNNNETPLSLFSSTASSNVYIHNTLPAVRESVKKNLNTSGADYYIFIPHLSPGEKVILYYDVNDTAIGIQNSSPFLITERYNVSKIPANRDVAWEVYLNISLNQSFFNSFPVKSDVQLNVSKFLSNNPSYYGSSNWTTLGPITNLNTNKGTDSPGNGRWGTSGYDSFNVTGIELNFSNIGNEYVNISFVVQGNNTGVSGHSFILDSFGFATLSFSFPGNVSGTRIIDVFAIGNASIAVNKSGPFQNSSGDWVVWRGNATITNKASGLTYILTNVTLYATETMNFSKIINGAVKKITPNEYLSPNESYNTSDDSSFDFTFEYENVPIIWANATFKLIKDTSEGWYTNYTTINASSNGLSEYIIIEKIYVIGSYLVKVTKHVIPNSSNVFDIYLVVENIGGQKSPYIYVYDMLPLNFSEYNWDNDWTDVAEDGNWVNKSSMFAGNGSVRDPMTGYSKGFWWRLNPLEGGADGNGSYTDYSEINANQSVVIFYQMSGSGEFNVLDAFVVGITQCSP